MEIVAKWILGVCVIAVIGSYEVSGSSIFQLEPVSLSNPENKDLDGRCCDGGSCQKACQPFFRICANVNKHASYGTCTLGSHTTDIMEPGNDLNITFYYNEPWPGSYWLIVEAWHAGNLTGKPSSEERASDRLITRLFTSGPLLVSDTWTPIHVERAGVALELAARATCDEMHHGPDCSQVRESVGRIRGSRDQSHNLISGQYVRLGDTKMSQDLSEQSEQFTPFHSDQFIKEKHDQVIGQNGQFQNGEPQQFHPNGQQFPVGQSGQFPNFPHPGMLPILQTQKIQNSQPVQNAPLFQNGQPFPNGPQMKNGQPFLNGQKFQNGQPFPNLPQLLNGQPLPNGPQIQNRQHIPNGQQFPVGPQLPKGQPGQAMANPLQIPGLPQQMDNHFVERQHQQFNGMPHLGLGHPQNFQQQIPIKRPKGLRTMRQMLKFKPNRRKDKPTGDGVGTVEALPDRPQEPIASAGGEVGLVPVDVGGEGGKPTLMGTLKQVNTVVGGMTKHLNSIASTLGIALSFLQTINTVLSAFGFR